MSCIEVTVNLDWEKATQFVRENRPELVDKIYKNLKSYYDEQPEEAEQYLPTHYFDQAGRYCYILEDAKDGRMGIGCAQDAMYQVVATWEAQCRLFPQAVADHAFEQWKNGHHDT